jgi:hypothetical protein
MSILDTEIERRRLANADLIAAQGAIEGAIAQFTEIDNLHKQNQQTSRQKLETIYKEKRHYTGKQVSVYTADETEKYPFYGGNLDTECNPYFPITKVKDKTFDGLAPLEALPTRTGAWARESSFALEGTSRNAAMTAIQAFPDISGETGAGFCTGATASTQTACTTAGGVWTPPFYAVGATATEKLRSALTAWKTDIQGIIADLYNNPGNTEQAFWENIITKIDAILPAIQVDVTYPGHTSNFTVGSSADVARQYLVAHASEITSRVSDRITFLNTEATTQESIFFGIVKLRLHQANGSYAKLQAAKSQKTTNKSIVDDNTAAIESLTLLKNS